MVQKPRQKRKNGVSAGVSRAALTRAKIDAPPQLTGEEREGTKGSAAMHQSGQDGRERLNLSVGRDVKKAVKSLAVVLGMSDSQLVVHALLMALPQLREQAVTAISFRDAPEVV